MNRLLPALALALGAASIAAPAARADDAADRTAVAADLVGKTLIRNLQAGFGAAVDKTVATMPEARAAAVRRDLNAEFDRQRAVMVEGLSREYAQRFSLDELKHLDAIYADPTYLKFQALNADPNAPATAISQGAVTKLLNTLAVADATEGPPPDAVPPAPTPTPAPPAGPAPAPAPK